MQDTGGTAPVPSPIPRRVGGDMAQPSGTPSLMEETVSETTNPMEETVSGTPRPVGGSTVLFLGTPTLKGKV